MFDRYFVDVLHMHPSFASYLGDRSADDRYENALSPRFQERYHNLMTRYSKALAKQPSSSSWTMDDRLMKYQIHIYQSSLSFQKHFDLIPISSYSNDILQIAFSESNYPGPSIARYGDQIVYIRQIIKNLRKGIQKKIVLLEFVCIQLIRDLEEFLKNKNYLFKYKNKNRLGDSVTSFLETNYRQVIEELVLFLRTEYLCHCIKGKEKVGLCTQFPRNGKEMYTSLVKYHCTLEDITPEEIMEFGVSEVARIEILMQGLDINKDDPTYHLKNGKEVLKAYKRHQRRIRETIMTRYFKFQVRPYEIAPIPKMMEASSPNAMYMAPSTRGRKGTFHINLRDVKENPTYMMETLAMHEGEPGHHYQFQYMVDKKLPLHRIYGFASTAFVEGWALYAESLSESDDPPTKFGRLTMEMFRAVRLVVDTGIHYYGWSYQKAFQYMKKHVKGMTVTELETELIRYICDPGQAVAYKIGERFFKAKSKEYGNDLKKFHDDVLQYGVVPLEMLKRYI